MHISLFAIVIIPTLLAQGHAVPANANAYKHLKPWVKGQSGNPSGKTQLPALLRSVKSLTQLEVTKIISKIARYSLPELQASLQDKGASVLEINIASIFHKSIQQGDAMRLSFLLDRCVGKIREIIEDDETRDATEELKKLSMNELLSIVKDNLPDNLNS